MRASTPAPQPDAQDGVSRGTRVGPASTPRSPDHMPRILAAILLVAVLVHRWRDSSPARPTRPASTPRSRPPPRAARLSSPRSSSHRTPTPMAGMPLGSGGDPRAVRRPVLPVHLFAARSAPSSGAVARAAAAAGAGPGAGRWRRLALAVPSPRHVRRLASPGARPVGPDRSDRPADVERRRAGRTDRPSPTSRAPGPSSGASRSTMRRDEDHPRRRRRAEDRRSSPGTTSSTPASRS